MANISINSVNIPVPPGGFKFRYRKVSGGSWSLYNTILAIPYVFTTPDPIHTNYEIEIYGVCQITPIIISTTNITTTNFTCICSINALNNLIISPCNTTNNTYTLTLDVTYTCMRNDLNQITSVIGVSIDGDNYYFNPTLATGTQTIQISGLNSDGLLHTISVNCVSND
jgi:hypothetical protein